MTEQQHISFGSIEQFRNVVHTVRSRAAYHGVSCPTLNFHGTVKLHGTNASVASERYSKKIYAQSRYSVLTPENDNAGFAQFVQENAVELSRLLDEASNLYPHRLYSHVIIFGEWCGGKIQKGVALNLLPKMFVIFAVRLYLSDESSTWLTPSEVHTLQSQVDSIKNIENYQIWDVAVDFEHPETAQNTFVELTQGVENLCPVGKAHGVEGVGEGIVWTCTGSSTTANDVSWAVEASWNDLCFKTKGEKHSDTKVRKIVQVDAEKVESIRVFVENVLTDHRLDKLIDKLREQNLEIDVTNTGAFLKLVGQDVEREERDTIEVSGFTWKDAVGQLNRSASLWFRNRCQVSF